MTFQSQMMESSFSDTSNVEKTTSLATTIFPLPLHPLITTTAVRSTPAYLLHTQKSHFSTHAGCIISSLAVAYSQRGLERQQLASLSGLPYASICVPHIAFNDSHNDHQMKVRLRSVSFHPRSVKHAMQGRWRLLEE